MTSTRHYKGSHRFMRKVETRIPPVANWVWITQVWDLDGTVDFSTEPPPDMYPLLSLQSVLSAIQIVTFLEKNPTLCRLKVVFNDHTNTFVLYTDNLQRKGLLDYTMQLDERVITCRIPIVFDQLVAAAAGKPMILKAAYEMATGTYIIWPHDESSMDALASLCLELQEDHWNETSSTTSHKISLDEFIHEFPSTVQNHTVRNMITYYFPVDLVGLVTNYNVEYRRRKARQSKCTFKFIESQGDGFKKAQCGLFLW